jgi:3-hydroxy-9,10-secoandrosta-1,3,5(10)-triene-9,17-dione monooxygenase reductase component
MLADDQESVSRKFAARGEDPFADVEHDLSPLGAPLLRGTVAGVECVVVDLLSGGDHTIVVGEVRQTVVNEHEPLLHFRGKYGRLARS